MPLKIIQIILEIHFIAHCPNEEKDNSIDFPAPIIDGIQCGYALFLQKGR